jgi:hypothetical protein
MMQSKIQYNGSSSLPFPSKMLVATTSSTSPSVWTKLH